MNTEQLNEHITSEITKLEKLAVDHVKRLAMQVIKSNSRKVSEFVMCMGTYFFNDKKGEPLYQHEIEALKDYKELEGFIDEWDGILHITGEAMRFHKDGITHYNW